MKLKKIASLMLAGIMAVSMLAGCKTSTTTDPETPDVTPVTGVAAIVNDTLDKNAEKISFTDNDVVTNLLENYFSENPISSSNWNNAPVNAAVNGWSSLTKLYSSLESMLGAENDRLNTGFSEDADEDGTYVNVYVLNSKYVTMDDALMMVAQHVDDLSMPAEGILDADDNATKDFAYSGTVAAIEAESKGGTESVWVIAVTVTQTATDK